MNLWRPSLSSTPGWIRSRSRRGITPDNGSRRVGGTTPRRTRFCSWRRSRGNPPQQRTVGYAVPPLQRRRPGEQWPQSTGAKGYRLREGGYQCQVYAASASTAAGSGFDLREVISRPKIPCASVLIRNLVATRADMPANKAVPQYEDGAYDSSSMYPTAVERRLYAHRLANPGPPVREVMLRPGEVDIFAQRPGHGMTEPATGAMDGELLGDPQFLNDRPLNYRRSDVYAASWASMAIDLLQADQDGVGRRGSPPAGDFYANSGRRRTTRVHAATRHGGLAGRPVWRDGFQSRQHVMHEPNMVVFQLIDVRALGSTTRAAGVLLGVPVFEEGTSTSPRARFSCALFLAVASCRCCRTWSSRRRSCKGSWTSDQRLAGRRERQIHPDKARRRAGAPAAAGCSRSRRGPTPRASRSRRTWARAASSRRARAARETLRQGYPEGVHVGGVGHGEQRRMAAAMRYYQPQGRRVGRRRGRLSDAALSDARRSRRETARRLRSILIFNDDDD